MIAARSDRALARILNPIVMEARETLNGIWIDTLDAAGYPRENAQQFIELTHYLLRGLFLAVNWLPYDVHRSEVVKVWHRLAPKILELVGPANRVGRAASTQRQIKSVKSKGAEVTRSSAGKNMDRSL